MKFLLNSVLAVFLFKAFMLFGKPSNNELEIKASSGMVKKEEDVAKRWEKEVSNLDFLKQISRSEIDSMNIDISNLLQFDSVENQYLSRYIGAKGQNFQRVDFLVLSAKKVGNQEYYLKLLFKNENKIDTLKGALKLKAPFYHTMPNMGKIYFFLFDYCFYSADSTIYLSGVNSTSFYINNGKPENYWFADGTFNEYGRTYVGTILNKRTNEINQCVFAIEAAGLYNCLPYCEDLYSTDEGCSYFYRIKEKYKPFGWQEYDYDHPKEDKPFQN